MPKRKEKVVLLHTHVASIVLLSIIIGLGGGLLGIWMLFLFTVVFGLLLWGYVSYHFHVRIEALLLLCIIGLTIGGGRAFLEQQHMEHLHRKAQQLLLKGSTPPPLRVVSRVSEKRNGEITFTACPETSCTNAPLIQVTTAPGQWTVLRGDTLQLSGRLQAPENSGESTFDYVSFLKKDAIFLVMQRPTIISVVALKGWDTTRILDILYDRTLRQILTLWPGDEGGFIAGILVGSKEYLSTQVKEDFKKTSLSHLVAISGFNITIIILFIGKMLSFLGKRSKIIITILCIILFMIFVGAGASVVRASLMGIISLLALFSERKAHVCNVLLLSGVCMTLFSPYTLLYDIGFQLSFLAVFGLLFMNAVLSKLFFFVPETLALRESLVLTCSAQCTTLPLLLYYFGQVSVISAVANILIGPFIPLIMLTSFLAVLLSPLLTPVALVVTATTTLLCSFVLQATHIMAQLPGSSFLVPMFMHIEWLLFFFGILVAVLFYLSTKTQEVVIEKA